MKIRLFLAWLLALPVLVQAQYSYSTNNGTLTITHYLGSDATVVVPATINNLPVTSVAGAFYGNSSLTSVTIPEGVTNIGDYTFDTCTNLVNVTLPNSLVNLGTGAFYACMNLAGIIIPNHVTTIGNYAFYNCYRLPSVAIPDSVSGLGMAAFGFCKTMVSASIGNGVSILYIETFYGCTNLITVTMGRGVTTIDAQAFQGCTDLSAIFFNGDAPYADPSIFTGDPVVAAYYLPGAYGWGSTLAGRPTALWQPEAQTSNVTISPGTNQFGFNINWASGQTVVVEVCTNLILPVWQPVQTNQLTSSSVYFSDPLWTNYSGRFYRLRSP